MSILTEALAKLNGITSTTDDENTITDSLYKTVIDIKFKGDKIPFGCHDLSQYESRKILN